MSHHMIGASRLFYEDDHVQVVIRPGTTSFTLVTFSNYGFRADGAAFWGSRLCDAENIDTVGFVAKANNWFPSVSMVEAIIRGSGSSIKPIVTYGHSQGGYGALKYSSLLGAQAVIACAPQYSIDPVVSPYDRRFLHHFDASIHKDMEIRKEDIGGYVTLVYDPFDPQDAGHARKIVSLSSEDNIRIVPITNIGHSIMDVMRDRQVTMGMLNASLTRANLSEILPRIRGFKKSSHSYGYRLAERLISKNKPAVALRVLDAVSRNASGIIDPAARARRAFIASRAYKAAGMAEEALLQSELATTLEPGNQRFLSWHQECLS